MGSLRPSVMSSAQNGLFLSQYNLKSPFPVPAWKKQEKYSFNRELMNENFYEVFRLYDKRLWIMIFSIALLVLYQLRCYWRLDGTKIHLFHLVCNIWKGQIWKISTLQNRPCSYVAGLHYVGINFVIWHILFENRVIWECSVAG